MFYDARQTAGPGSRQSAERESCGSLSCRESSHGLGLAPEHICAGPQRVASLDKLSRDLAHVYWSPKLSPTLSIRLRCHQ